MDINKETLVRASVLGVPLKLSASDIILDAMLVGKISKEEAIVLLKAIGFYQ